MLRLLGYPLVALALFAMAGGHWAVLRTVAWAGMMAERIEQKTTLRQAVSETLDGEHPCAMCHQIEKSKAAEQKPDGTTPGSSSPFALKMAKKAEAVASADFLVPAQFLSALLFWRSSDEVAVRRAAAPSLRPPRGGLSFIA